MATSVSFTAAAPADGTASREVSARLLRRAVHQHRLLSIEGMLERLFTLSFQNLVYPQIWEDPRTDMAALAIKPDSRMILIASGGCNMMSYLTANPAHIIAVDLNAAHVALNRLKLAAVQHLPDQAAFFRMFGLARGAANVAAYDRYLKPRLDADTRRYWEARSVSGRRRISMFARNFYRFGLLGRCIMLGHLVARLHGHDPRRLLAATSLAEQREIFDRELAPLFDRKLVRWALDHRIALYGLGIPPAQYAALQSSGRSMADELRARVERLACGTSFSDNYFAWQAFNRSYPSTGEEPLPPYLAPDNYSAVKARADRVSVRQISFTQCLQTLPESSLDRYVLLDAQDWMTDADLTTLWTQITRTARPGARVLFRTAAEPTLLPGRVPDGLLSRWHYDEAASRKATASDRSAIYGGTHLYVRAEGG